jgi:orotate phosphoribosyltransferase
MDNKLLRNQLYQLIKDKAFYCENVVLSSGKQSSCYVDIRRISLQSKGNYLISNLLWEKINKEDFTAVGGPTLGADPIIAGLSYLAYLENKPINTFIVRKEQKKHGKTKLIEGPPLKEGAKVIIIDDVATSGKSLITAIEKLNSLGITVTRAYTVIDRKEGAAQALAQHGCILESLFTLDEFKL